MENSLYISLALMGAVGFVIGFSVGYVIDKKQDKDIFGPRDKDC